MVPDFPLAYALTQRFTLGEPRNLALFGQAASSFGLFLRSDTGDDPTHHLWVVSLVDGQETKLVDARHLAGMQDGELPAAERARRERLREGGAGITSYATSADGTVIAFALAGRLFVVEQSGREQPGREQPGREQPGGDQSGREPTGRAFGHAAAREIKVAGSVFDPRPSPDGALVAFASGADLVVVDLQGVERLRLSSSHELESWGTPDFVAAEEMGRTRGFWWSPDSQRIAVCRNDASDVVQWWISNPAVPGAAPVPHRYPQAGTANPRVTLFIATIGGIEHDATDGDAQQHDPMPVTLDLDHFPYLATMSWGAAGLVAGAQTRDQRNVSYFAVAPDTGTPIELRTVVDDRWVDLIPGCGVLTDAGLVTTAEAEGARRVFVGPTPVSPPNVQVHQIVSADDDGILIVGNTVDAPTERHIFEWRPTPADEGFVTDDDSVAGWRPDVGSFDQLTNDPGVHAAVGRVDSWAIRHSGLSRPGVTWTLPGGHQLDSVAWTPPVRPEPHFIRTGPLQCSTAVLLPTGHDGSPLPVLLDPYGGPHGARVLGSYNAHVTSQWFADQGFAVIVVDGRGTPGRGSEFERLVWGDLARGVLDDQVAGLHDAKREYDFLDLTRVAIRGWSFGGYLAALAVLQRPDVFHTAVAGAPVTDWLLYDTHYTERYLGHPDEYGDHYRSCSLIEMAPELTRPLLLIHGLADDNVVAAHTLQLSSALLAAGRGHEVLPLSGVTHMTPQAEVAQNLLLHQLQFMRHHLGLGDDNG